MDQLSGLQLFTAEIECEACNATGIYVGYAEKDGAGVVCGRCNGAGKIDYKFTYRLFKERKKREDVTRVFASHGFFSFGVDKIFEKGPPIHFSKYGVSYEDWLKGEKPKPVKAQYCPLVYDREMQEDKHPKHEFFNKHCRDNCSIGTMITQCPLNNRRSECWEKYEGLKNE